MPDERLNAHEITDVSIVDEMKDSYLRFAMSVEPNNAKLAARYEQVKNLRARGQSTVPATMAEEKQTNPFLRWESKEIQASVKAAMPDTRLDPEAVFAAVRKMKDAF